jgi:hypothetical protein
VPDSPGRFPASNAIVATVRPIEKVGQITRPFATREDLSRKSTVSRELVADYWMDGLF